MSQTPVSALSPVPFHGDTIFCATIDGQPFTPVKPIIENLGLVWGAQQQKLSAKKDRWGISIFDIPSNKGIQRTLCMPVRKLPAFLASINPKKVRAELRPKIELYQAECDDALWNYWTKGRADRASVKLSAPALVPQPVKLGVRLHTREFGEHKLRMVTYNGSLWIAVKDLGLALGYAAASGWLPKELPAVWEGMLGRDSFSGAWKIVSPRPGKCCAPRVRMLSEKAVRAMIERCTKHQARDFEGWLKNEVIPSLREEGWYGRMEALPQCSPAPMALPEPPLQDENNAGPSQRDPGLLPEVFQEYLRLMEQQRRIVEDLLGKIFIEAKPYLLATARDQASRRGKDYIAPLVLAYLNPFYEAQDAFARGFRITRHMAQAAEFLSHRRQEA